MTKKNETASVSDFNMQKLTTPELAENISATIKFGGNIGIFGLRGSGKTSIAKQEIKNSGCKELYLNLSVLERVDLGGYPNVMSGNNSDYISFFLPEFYRALTTGNQKVVALLDEVDKADPSLWAPLLEFTQFRSVNGRALPNLHAIIMTGNLLSEGGSRPSLPLLDRAEKYLIDADTSSWLNWAGKEGKIHPSVTSYLHDHPKDLFGNPDPEDRYADPSPRSWERASQVLQFGEENNWNPDLLLKKVSGCVGKTAGLKYSHYYEHYQLLLPKVEKIFKGKDIKDEYNKLEPTKQLVCTMIVCARMAKLMDDRKDDTKTDFKELEYVANYLSYVASEQVLIGVRSQINFQRLINWNLNDHPTWKPVLDKVKRALRCA